MHQKNESMWALELLVNDYSLDIVKQSIPSVFNEKKFNLLKYARMPIE